MADDNFNNRLNDALKRNHIDLTGDEPIHVTEESSGLGEASSGLASGMRMSMEFLSGTLVGLAIGWGVDSYFHTMPWFLLLFTLLGFGAGIMNVYRSVNQISEGIGINRQNVLTKRGEAFTQKPTD